MALDHEYLMGLGPIHSAQDYDHRDTILYALGIGLGQPDAEGGVDLRYVYEADLVAFPTMSLTLASGPAWFADPRTGIDMTRMVHGEQRIVFGAALPPRGSVTAASRIEAVHDKGPGKAALLTYTRTLTNAATGEVISTATGGLMLRGQGGFSGAAANPAPAPPAPPARPADIVVSLPTRPEQALIYRLSGDYTAMHADPARAAVAGFPGPILHGLCTYAIAARAAVGALCGGDPSRLAAINARFASPVYPGETLRTEFWRGAGDETGFRASVVERDVVVLSNGVVRTRPGAAV